MDYVLEIHSWVRWAIVLVAVVAVVKFALGWLRKQEFKAMDRGLASGFSGLMDLQMLLGLIVLFGAGFTGAGFPMYRVEHAITMTLAVVAGHTPALWRKAPDAVRFRNTLFAILVSLALVYVAVAALPGNGWIRQ